VVVGARLMDRWLGGCFAERLAEEAGRATSAPKGAPGLERLAISLKRYPDTNLFFHRNYRRNLSTGIPIARNYEGGAGLVESLELG